MELVQTINQKQQAYDARLGTGAFGASDLLFEAYRGVTEDDLWRNLEYFLSAKSSRLPRRTAFEWPFTRMIRLGDLRSAAGHHQPGESAEIPQAI